MRVNFLRIIISLLMPPPLFFFLKKNLSLLHLGESALKGNQRQKKKKTELVHFLDWKVCMAFAIALNWYSLTSAIVLSQYCPWRCQWSFYYLVILQPNQRRSCSRRAVDWKAEIRQEESTETNQCVWWPSWKRESKLWWLPHAKEIKVSCSGSEDLCNGHFGFHIWSLCKVVIRYL